MIRPIFHILTPERLRVFSHADSYEAESLHSEGFIHCSFDHQLDGVIARYYSGENELSIIEIDPSKLESPLVEEPSTKGEIYPHVYGPINKGAVVAIINRKK